jgi:hypothetical protein
MRRFLLMHNQVHLSLMLLLVIRYLIQGPHYRLKTPSSITMRAIPAARQGCIPLPTAFTGALQQEWAGVSTTPREAGTVI